MTATLSIERTASGGIRIAGRITVDNAAAALAQGRVSGTSGMIGPVDVAELQSADSVTLAVLLAWAAQARRHGGQLTYAGASPRLRAIAYLSDAEGLLGFDEHA